MPKLKSILLIDDDESTNFLHQIVIEKSAITESVQACGSGQAALDYLSKAINGEYPQPDLIFLDINMPRMNGWEFLEEYDKLSDEQKGKMVVVMLTTSINPDDKAMAESLGYIAGFKNKPLTVEILQELCELHFGAI